MSESDIQAQLQREATAYGVALWRNNSGAVKFNGRLVRYGMANTSSSANKRLKSADLIGLHHGRFVSLEVKASVPDFISKKSAQKAGQLAWQQLIHKLGGWAIIADESMALLPDGELITVDEMLMRIIS